MRSGVVVSGSRTAALSATSTGFPGAAVPTAVVGCGDRWTVDLGLSLIFRVWGRGADTRFFEFSRSVCSEEFARAQNAVSHLTVTSMSSSKRLPNRFGATVRVGSYGAYSEGTAGFNARHLDVREVCGTHFLSYFGELQWSGLSEAPSALFGPPALSPSAARCNCGLTCIRHTGHDCPAIRMSRLIIPYGDPDTTSHLKTRTASGAARTASADAARTAFRLPSVPSFQAGCKEKGQTAAHPLRPRGFSAYATPFPRLRPRLQFQFDLVTSLKGPTPLSVNLRYAAGPPAPPPRAPIESPSSSTSTVRTPGSPARPPFSLGDEDDNRQPPEPTRL